MNKFLSVLEEHGEAGIVPSDGSAYPNGGAPLIQNVNGYGLRELLVSAICGVILAIGIAAVILLWTGSTLIGPSDRRIVEAVHETEIKINTLSREELKSRLSYTAEEGRLILDVFHDSHPDFVEYIGMNLRNLSLTERQTFMVDVLNVVRRYTVSPLARKFLTWSLQLDDDTIIRLINAESSMPAFLRQFELLPPEVREYVTALRPSDLISMWRTKGITSHRH